MNNYELMLMYKPDAKEADVKKHIKEVSSQIEKLGGKSTKEDYWGLKNLAYEMKKFTSAYYNVLNFEANPDKVDELKQWLRLQENILLRNLLTKV